MNTAKRIYGIDLGTTYSCIAYVDEHGKPIVVANAEGQQTTPSVVFFESANNIVVGKAAKDVAEMYPDRVVSTVKRAMGVPDWIFENNDRKYRPQEISAFILRKLVADAERVTGDKITEVVITCPAYFGVTERAATRQAGELAGLKVPYVIQEPTAAALAYDLSQSEEQVVLVYDLGGGTFDITLIELKKDAINVLCTGGDHVLGGKNWDEAVASWFAQQFSNHAGVPTEKLTTDPESWQTLLNTAEVAKVALSSRSSYSFPMRFEGERVVVDLTRDKFNELTAHLLERTLSLTDDLLEMAKAKGHSRIDKLLLVGGSTYMPQVIERVKARFPFEVRQFDPNQAVAKGAALCGYKYYLEGRVADEVARQTGKSASQVDLKRVDQAVRVKAELAVAQSHGLALPAMRALTKPLHIVASKSFGILITDTATGLQRVNNLIVLNESVPRRVARRYVTKDENQTAVLLQCMENREAVGAEGMTALEASTRVGCTELQFTRALPKGAPIEVTFSLAEDGTLSVHGKDLTTHQEVNAEFKTGAIMTVEEVQVSKSRNLALAVS